MINSALTRFGVAIKSRLVREDEGATAVEYGLIVGLIAVAIIVAVGILGTTLAGFFETINGELAPAAP